MNNSYLPLKHFRIVKSACAFALVGFVSVAFAQQRLSGVPNADDIARALAKPAGVGPVQPKMRTRGLMLEKSADDAPESEAKAPQNTAAAPAAAGKSGSLFKQPPAAQKAPAPTRAVDLEIQFAFGSDRLTAEGRAVLDQLGAALRSDALSDVTGLILEGHTDGVGSAQSNRNLSLRRARSAQQYLSQRHMINPSAIQAVGKGSSELADPANPADGVNRRVRVIVEG
jgi:OmpA-OmpF porin, OOP family